MSEPRALGVDTGDHHDAPTEWGKGTMSEGSAGSVAGSRTAPAFITACCAVLLACGETPTGEVERAQPELVGLSVTPTVTGPDESFLLEIEVRGAEQPELEVQLQGRDGGPIRLDGRDLDSDLGSFVVYDDGTRGDRAPGDDVFTRVGLRLPPGPGGVASARVSSVRVRGVLFEIEQTVRLSFRSVDPDVAGQPPVVELGPDARATPRVLSLAHGRALDLGSDALAAIVGRYFELLPEDRDLVTVIRPSYVESDVSGVAYVIRPWAEGLGTLTARPGFDEVAPHVRAVLDVRAPIWLRSRFASPDGAFCPLIHELTHQWAAYTGSPLSDATGHWVGGVLDRAMSGLGVSDVCRLNDLELYLAGWLPTDSLTTPLSFDGFSIQDLVEDIGPRVPAESPRDLTMSVIVLGDRLLSDQELAYYERVVAEVTAPSSGIGGLTWEEATGGRSRIDALLPLPGGAPGTARPRD